MTNKALEEALDNIYASLKNDNEKLDTHIHTLKSIMHEQGMKAVTVDTAKLMQPNREGRKLMQSYFKKRGVIVQFAAE
ncbi:MAG TPA: hypothetical protein VFT64_11790 [Rickettsiales bacterium]|nr:hypothetical protein [Rickettsiales bacterium]